MNRQVAAIIPAKNEANRIVKTVKAVQNISAVDLVVVVDDGSSDNTAELAFAAGAVVVKHPRSQGKGQALMTGAQTAAIQDTDLASARHLLFVDADLAESAEKLESLIEPVNRGEADLTIGVLPTQAGAAGRGLVKNLAYKSIYKITGFKAQAPLSGQRCIRQEVFSRILPLAKGWGVETAMTIKVLKAGYVVKEVPVEVYHRATGNDLAGNLHRLKQYLGVLKTVWFIKRNK